MPAHVGYGPAVGNARERGCREGHAVGFGQRHPELVESLGDERDDVDRAIGGIGIRVVERQIAGVGVERVELDVDERADAVVGEERRATCRAAFEAVLERADAVEARAVCIRARQTTGLDRVADVDHRDQAGAHGGVVEGDQVAAAGGDVGSPRTGEAVGLLLLEYAGVPSPARAWMAWPNSWASTTATASWPSMVDQMHGRPVEVVVGHEVADDAVERRTGLDVFVARCIGATTGNGGLTFG